MMRALAAALYLTSAAAVAAPQNHAPFHKVEADLQPATGKLRITDAVTVSGRGQFIFRVAPWLQIDRLLVDGRAGSATRLGHRFRIQLSDTGEHLLEFKLSGTVPLRNRRAENGGRASSSGNDGVYLPGFAAWIPLHEDGRVRYHLAVRVPREQRAVATGKLISEQTGSDWYRATFSSERTAEPPSLFTGPYAVREIRSGEIRVRTYLHPELRELADTYLTSAQRFLKRYAADIGDYPYADFHIISAPLPVGLGFPNLTYVGRQVLPLPFMQGRSLAHEILHNWWGNGVAVDFASGNWSEGLTTYMADYALAVEQGNDAARAMRLRWLRDYAALPPERDRAVIAFRGKHHQASQVLGYNKVAFIFHMLDAEIGQPAFADGVRRFWASHAHGTAGWPELQAAFERAAGRDLEWFFAQWLTRTGAPRLNLGNTTVHPDDGGFRVNIEVRQAAPWYRLRLPVAVTTHTGTEMHIATVADAVTQLEFSATARPLSLHIDPESDVFRRLQREETPPILRDVTLHPAAVTVVSAQDSGYRAVARELAAKLMDTTPRYDSAAGAPDASAPLLLIADRAAAANLLARIQVEQPPALQNVSSSAVVWAARRPNGVPVLVVTAQDTRSLRALLRPLPHYGAQSYVLFNGGRAVQKGVWPVTRGPLYRVLDHRP